MYKIGKFDVGSLFAGRGSLFALMLGLVVLFGLPVDAFAVPPATTAASGDIIALSTSWGSQMVGAKNIMVSLAALVGVFLFIVGVWMFYKESKQPGQGHGKNGMVAIFVGASLFSIAVLIGLASGTLWNDSANAKTAAQGGKVSFAQ